MVAKTCLMSPLRIRLSTICSMQDSDLRTCVPGSPLKAQSTLLSDFSIKGTVLIKIVAEIPI